MTGQPDDVWASGEDYEPYVGRWSRLVTRDFLAWLRIPPGLRWLDVGCGTGALSSAIIALAEPRELAGLDPAAGFVVYARAHLTDDRARFAVGDARDIPFASGAFDAVVSGLMLNFVPQPLDAVVEMARVARPGGVVAAYVWDYAGEMQLMRHFWDAVMALDPAAAHLDEGRRFPLCQPEPLAELYRAAGLHAVDVCAIDVPTHFRDFDDFWEPFLGGQGPAPGYVLSLDEEPRDRLRERLRATLPTESDGTIQLIARAWGVRGER